MNYMNISAILVSMLLSAATMAKAVTIDFESLAHNDDAVTHIGAVYSEDGFILENLATVDSSGFEPAFATYGTTHEWFAGSTSLINDNYQGVTRFSSANGSFFSLSSIEVSELWNHEVQELLTFIGLKADGTTVSQTFALDGLFGFETFYFDALFTDLVDLTWVQTDYFVQVDNINVVPEPSTILLFGAGLATCTAMARSRRRPI